MKQIRLIGLVLFVVAMSVFVLSITLGEYRLTQEVLTQTLEQKHQETLGSALQPMLDKTYSSSFAFVSDFQSIFNEVNNKFKSEQAWDKVIYTDYVLSITKNASVGVFVNNQFTFFLLSFVLGIVGALMYILPKVKLAGHPGIKNNHIFHKAATSRGWVGILIGTFLIGFYILLYFFPQYITNWILMMDPISMALSGNPS